MQIRKNEGGRILFERVAWKHKGIKVGLLKASEIVVAESFRYIDETPLISHALREIAQTIRDAAEKCCKSD